MNRFLDSKKVSITLIVLIFATLVFWSILSLNEEKEQPVSANGIIDLSTWDFGKEEPVQLDGQWAFYWKRFIMSSELKSNNPDAFVRVPSVWNDYSIENKEIDGQGYASYQLKVKIKHQTESNLAVKIGYINMAYALYVDDEKIAECGNIGTDKFTSKSDNFPQVVEINPKDDEFEMMLLVSNFDYPRGGIRDSIIIGTKDQLMKNRNFNLALQLLLSGGLLYMFGYFLIIKFFYRKYPGAFYFSIFCLSLSVRNLVVGEVPILNILDMDLFSRIEMNYLSGCIISAALYGFIHDVFSDDKRKKGQVMVNLIALLLVLSILILPASIYANYVLAIYISMIAAGVNGLLFIHRNRMRIQINTTIMMAGLGVFLMGILNDMLYNNGLIIFKSNYMSTYTMNLLIIIMAVVQAKTVSRANLDLEESNKKLEEAGRLKDRIRATEMAFLQAQIKPHFLFNTLNSIASLALTDGRKTAELVADFSSYLRESFAFENIDDLVSLEKEMALVNSYYNITKARFGDKYKLIISWQDNVSFLLPPLTIQPLIENAIKHGGDGEGSGLSIVLKIWQDQEDNYISVEDNGNGIELESTDTQESCFFGEGIGLKNINARLLHQFGNGLIISSSSGHGFKVEIKITRDTDAGRIKND